MKEDVKDLWVAALRSGKYTQTKSVLKYNGSHCCLGVLCELSGVEETPHSQAKELSSFGVRLDTHLLPSEVMKWSGMTTVDGYIPYIGRPLSELNDAGFTFDQIADVIEYFWRDFH